MSKVKMDNKYKNSRNAGNWIGVCTAVGAAVYASTNEPVWIAVGVAIGAALSRTKPKNKNEECKRKSINKSYVSCSKFTNLWYHPFLKSRSKSLQCCCKNCYKNPQIIHK